MRDKKGQIAIGAIIITAIALIVGLIMFQTIAQEIGSSTNTVSTGNKTYASVANGSYITLDGAEVVGDVTAWNATAGNGTLIASGNYTVTNREVVNGNLVSRLQIINPQFASTNASSWNLSYTYEPTTYIDDSGGRAIATIVVVFFALAILVAALYPLFEGRLMEMLGR